MLFNSIDIWYVDPKGLDSNERSFIQVWEEYSHILIRFLQLWGGLFILLMYFLSIIDTSFVSNKKKDTYHG